MRTSITYAALVLAFVAIGFIACEKDGAAGPGCTDPNALNYNENATEDDGSCEYFDDSGTDTTSSNASGAADIVGEDIIIYNFGNNSAENGYAGKAADSTLAIPSCATFTFDNGGGPNQFPKILTLDFGSGCVCEDGKTRAGQLEFTFYSLWRLHNTGDSVTVALNNYSVNDTIYTGSRSFWLEHFSLSSNTMGVGYRVNNASIIYPDGSSLTWAGTGTFNITGNNTPADYTDDLIEIDVSGGGQDETGSEYSLSTPTPLLHELGCMDGCAFIQGELSITTMGTTTQDIDGFQMDFDTETTITVMYGDGSCDGSLEYWVHVVVGNSGNEILNETYGPDTVSCNDF